jgi:acetyl-CoA carboxylase, biotin carboxylase subunit
MFQKILIANRGEIAVRIHRACKELGIQTVAVHSTADSHAMHVRLADESVCIGPPRAQDSYLNIPAILTAATMTGVDAIHPGIGFLSQSAHFAEVIEEHGLVFIGPKPDHMRIMGDKLSAKEQARLIGLPTLPGSSGPLENEMQAIVLAEEIGFPVLIKAAFGGGGKGMQICYSKDQLKQAIQLAEREAEASFGNKTIYLEKYLDHPRHIEIQVLADTHGNVIHLYERDCSIQRRYQKVIEEGPSAVLTQDLREYIAKTTQKAIHQLGYQSAGTVEYLYQDGQFYFIEMNTRLQVEHCVTEALTGIDLVKEQIRIAAGLPLSYKQSDICVRGHAIECRINAENAETFLPSPGTVSRYHPAGGPGIRVDSALFSGASVPPYYDSLIAKLVVYGESREECLLRIERALQEFVIEGVETNIPLHLKIIQNQNMWNHNYDVHWLEKMILAEKHQ